MGRGHVSNKAFAQAGTRDYSYLLIYMARGRAIHSLIEKKVIENESKYGKVIYYEKRINYPDGSYGQADLISISGEIWEIKPNNHAQATRGISQVEKYCSGSCPTLSNDVKLIAGGYIESDYVEYNGQIIEYSYYGGGVIVYDDPYRKSLPVSETVPVTVPERKKIEERLNLPVPATPAIQIAKNTAYALTAVIEVAAIGYAAKLCGNKVCFY